jgi:hypothetical protein
MKSVSVWGLSAALAVSLASVLVAQAPALDVRMGLWEVSSTTQVGGQMPDVDTSKMTPEQKARVEEAMKGMMGGHTNVTKTCMTREKLEKQAFMDSDRHNCKQTMNTNTRTVLESSVTCTGENAMTAQMRIEAASPTSVKGMIKSENTMRGKTMNVNVNLTARWLGADCGDVK